MKRSSIKVSSLKSEIFWERLFFKRCYGNAEKYHADGTCMATCSSEERKRCFVACYNSCLKRDELLARKYKFIEPIPR